MEQNVSLVCDSTETRNGEIGKCSIYESINTELQEIYNTVYSKSVCK